MDEGAIMDHKAELTIMQELVSEIEPWVLKVMQDEGGELRVLYGNVTMIGWFDNDGEHRLTIFRKCESRPYTDHELDEDWFASKR